MATAVVVLGALTLIGNSRTLNMRISDLTLADIKAGKNWRASDFAAHLGPLHSMLIEETDGFRDDDTVVYPGVFISDSGKVSALLLIKRVGDIEIGGDYCELHEGQWRQVGLEPDPNAEFGREAIASPLAQDPSFESEGDGLRFENQQEFLSHVKRLGD
ncbi:MAG: hypothetical protein GY720_04300 [bacterium]|nr:hypothetical protein [bacterium]